MQLLLMAVVGGFIPAGGDPDGQTVEMGNLTCPGISEGKMAWCDINLSTIYCVDRSRKIRMLTACPYKPQWHGLEQIFF